jgi:hypothetical protein
MHYTHRLGADGSNRRRRRRNRPLVGPRGRWGHAPLGSGAEGPPSPHLICLRASIHFKVDPVEREIKATTTDAIGRCFNLRHQSERERVPPVCRPRPAASVSTAAVARERKREMRRLRSRRRRNPFRTCAPRPRPRNRPRPAGGCAQRVR